MLKVLTLFVLAVGALFAQPTITTTSLAAGRVGAAYDTTLLATGGTAPYTWSVVVGSLPASLSVNASTGEITGTPTVATTTNFTVRVTDAASAHADQALSVLIVASLSGIATSGGPLTYPTSTPGANVLTNPGFETGNFTGWTQSFPGSFTIDTVQKHSGSFSAEINNTGTNFPPIPALTQSVTIGPGTYTFSGWMMMSGFGGGGSGARFCVDVLGCTDVQSGTMGWTQFTFSLTTANASTTTNFGIDVFGAPSGQAWFDDVTLFQEQYPISTFLLYPNYRGIVFSDQSQVAQFDVTVVPPAGAGAIGTFTTTLKVQDETSLSFICNVSHTSVAHEVIPCDMTGQNTAHTYLATEQIADGSNTYTSPNFRMSLAAGSTRNAMAFSYDVNNRFLLLGQPTFLLGVYDSGLSFFTDENSYVNQFDTLRRLFQLPLNFYLNYQFGAAPTNAMLPLMNVLQSRGVYMLTNANCTFPTFTIEAQGFWFTGATTLDQQTRAAHPGFLGYYVADECLGSMAPDVFGQRAAMVSSDLGGSTFATLNRDTASAGTNPTGTAIPPFALTADVLAQDPYPFFGGGPYDFSVINSLIVETATVSKNARPVGAVLQFFQGGGGAPWPVQADLRNMCYMAVASGSNACVFWELGQGGGALAGICDGSDANHLPSGSSSWCPAKVTEYGYLTNVMTELSTLQVPLSAIDDTTTCVSNSLPASIAQRCKTVGGLTYLIASNLTNGTVTPTFTMLRSIQGSVTVFNESRSVTPSAATFTDSFTAFAAHVYQLSDLAATSGSGVANGLGVAAGKTVK